MSIDHDMVRIDCDVVHIDCDTLEIDRDATIFTVRPSKIKENQIRTHPMEYSDACQHAPTTHQPSEVYFHALF